MTQRVPHWINGAPRDAAGGGWLPVHAPASGAVYVEAVDGDGRDVETAIAAAQAAWPMWSALPASERTRWLEKLATALESRIEDFARAEARDGGKPVALARQVEIPRAVGNPRFFAHAATQFSASSTTAKPGCTTPCAPRWAWSAPFRREICRFTCSPGRSRRRWRRETRCSPSPRK